jgi:hypothetical protein
VAGLVQLIKGDLFDGPSDLVVLPCSTAGTFTSLVAQRLRLFSIPAPRSMALGEVEIHPLQDAAHVAQFAAFAASVAGFKSTPDAIQKIGAALGRATEDRTSIRVVNAPLLGAGAGGIRVGAEDFRDALSSAREDRPSEVPASLPPLSRRRFAPPADRREPQGGALSVPDRGALFGSS